MFSLVSGVVSRVSFPGPFELIIIVVLIPLVTLRVSGLLREELVGVIMLKAVLRINIQIINTDWLVVLSQFNVVEIRTFLIDVMHDDEVVHNLQLVQVLLGNDDALAEFKLVLRIKLVEENLACLGREMEHIGFVVQRGYKYLMLVSFVIQTRGEALIFATLFINLLVLGCRQEHF